MSEYSEYLSEYSEYLSEYLSEYSEYLSEYTEHGVLNSLNTSPLVVMTIAKFKTDCHVLDIAPKRAPQ